MTDLDAIARVRAMMEAGAFPPEQAAAVRAALDAARELAERAALLEKKNKVLSDKNTELMLEMESIRSDFGGDPR